MQRRSRRRIAVGSPDRLTFSFKRHFDCDATGRHQSPVADGQCRKGPLVGDRAVGRSVCPAVAANFAVRPRLATPCVAHGQHVQEIVTT